MTTNVATAAAPPIAPTVAFPPLPLVTPAVALPAAPPIAPVEIALARLPPAKRAGTLPPLPQARRLPAPPPIAAVAAPAPRARQPGVLVMLPPNHIPRWHDPRTIRLPITLSWKDTASRILNLTLLNRASEHISFSLRREHSQAIKRSWDIQGGLLGMEVAFSFLLMPIRLVGKLIVLALRFVLFIAAAITSLVSGDSRFIKEAGKLFLLSLLRMCLVLPIQLALQTLNTLAILTIVPLLVIVLCKKNPNGLFRLSRKIDHYFDQWEVFIDSGNRQRLSLQPRIAKRYNTDPAYDSRFCNYVFARPTTLPPSRSTRRRQG